MGSGLDKFFGSYEDEGNGLSALFFGGAVLLWSAIHDFRTLDRSVELYNRRHTGTTISVSPTYFTSRNAPGIAVSVSF